MAYNPVAIHLGLVIGVHEENGTEMSLRIRFPDAKKTLMEVLLGTAHAEANKPTG